MRRALITGITGQDGSYLAELLIAKGYQVHGVLRRASSSNASRLEEVYQDPHERDQPLVLHYGDRTDSVGLVNVPDDFVIATGESHTVQEFCELAFEHAGLDWRKHVNVDLRYYRPSEIEHLRGDASKAESIMGWHPRTRFPDLVRLMVDADISLLEDELAGRTVRIDR
jgi:GDP-D-mannose dehydratase